MSTEVAEKTSWPQTVGTNISHFGISGQAKENATRLQSEHVNVLHMGAILEEEQAVLRINHPTTSCT
jgi:hypothetical protein